MPASPGEIDPRSIVDDPIEWLHMKAIGSWPCVVLFCSAGATALTDGPAASQAASRPLSGSGGGDHIVVYKPGVAINWTRRQVELAGRIALREGPLELFACATAFDGSAKTHESIVLLEGRPLHIYQALGLVGLQPGHPPRWDSRANKAVPATGQPLELRVEWVFDGQRQEADVGEWMQFGGEPNRPVGPLPWVFAGSVARPDGSILADEDGTVATVVDFDGSIIGLSASHSADNSQLWLAARPSKIPPLNAPCTLIVRALGLRLEMDRFGRVSVDRRRLDPESLADEVRRYLKANPQGILYVLVAPTASEADIQVMRRHLRAAGAPDSAVRVLRQPDTDFPANDPAASKALLRSQLPLQQSMFDAARREHARLIEQMSRQRRDLEKRTSVVAEYISWLEEGLARLAGRTPASAPASRPDHRPTGTAEDNSP